LARLTRPEPAGGPAGGPDSAGGGRRVPRIPPWVAAGLVLALAAAVSVLALRSQREKPRLTPAARACGPPTGLIPVGGQLPGGCKVEILGSGAAVPISEIAAGKPLVVNFWSTSCPNCVQEMPDLQKVYAAAAGQVQFLGLDLLGVQGEVRPAAVAFARQRAVAYPLAYDDAGLLYGRISLRYLLPTTAFVRADGTLAGFHLGQVSAADLRDLVRRYLGVQVPA
jgi:thiol-disulfide isomerase/thioredoxin